MAFRFMDLVSYKIRLRLRLQVMFLALLFVTRETINSLHLDEKVIEQFLENSS